MRHFLRGRTGANSVLNKEKISVQFPPHPTSSHEIHRDTTFFSIFSFLILITYCILQVRYHQSNSCCISITKVKRQYNIIGGWGGLCERERERGERTHRILCKPLLVKYSRIIFTTIPMLDTIAHHFFHRHQPLPVISIRHSTPIPDIFKHQSSNLSFLNLFFPHTNYFASLCIQKRVSTRIRTEPSPTISIVTIPLRSTMAEEANVALSNPTTSGAEKELSQQDSGAKAADIAMDEGTSEPYKEGAGQEEVADRMSNPKRPYSETRLTTVFFQPLRPTGTQITPLKTSPPLPPRRIKILKCKTLQNLAMPRELNLVQLYIPPMVHLLSQSE